MSRSTVVLFLSLFICIPLSIAAKVLGWSETAIFFTSAAAIAPLSVCLATATEKVALVTGPTIGGLVNALFGNSTELIIAIVALRKGLVDIVEASITGSILGALLLLLGLAMLAGGLQFKEQSFRPIRARVNGISMTLAVTAIAVPSMVINTSNLVDPLAIHNLSLVVATILIIVYALTLVFSLKTHSYLYQVSQLEDIEEEKPNLWVWLLVLSISTLAIALESELFVSVVESETTRLGFTSLFTGVILLPLISDIAGYVTVIRLARRNKMDLVMATISGDSLLIALFVAPVLVFIGQAIGQPIDLNFNLFQVIAVAIAVAVTNLICFGGRSNWLDGTLLLATYLVLGVAFYYHPESF
jgi:Ca2+:H+ antiporter